MGFFEKIKNGLKKTRAAMANTLGGIFASFSGANEEFYEELEESMILADIGVETSCKAVEQLRAVVKERKLRTAEEIHDALKDILVDMLNVGDTSLKLGTRPSVVLVIGVNGVGKTTTKEMIAAVLRTALRTQWTEKNYNNEIGLPVSVLRLKPDCEAAVLEMGMNHFGELSVLTRIAQPDLAVITNIGTMHIENLGSREGILRAKLEILEGLRPGGRVIFNGDDALLRPLSGTWYWLAIRGVLFLLPLAVCLVLALVFRKKLAARRERDPIDPKWRRLFFRTPGWIIFLVLSCVCIILNFFVLGA